MTKGTSKSTLCYFYGVLTWFLILGCRRMWLWWLMKCTMIQIQHTPVALDELKGSIGELHWRPFNWVSGQLLHFQISPLELLMQFRVALSVAVLKNYTAGAPSCVTDSDRLVTVQVCPPAPSWAQPTHVFLKLIQVLENYQQCLK